MLKDSAYWYKLGKENERKVIIELLREEISHNKDCMVCENYKALIKRLQERTQDD